MNPFKKHLSLLLALILLQGSRMRGGKTVVLNFQSTVT